MIDEQMYGSSHAPKRAHNEPNLIEDCLISTCERMLFLVLEVKNIKLEKLGLEMR